jgi:hypothetical protein
MTTKTPTRLTPRETLDELRQRGYTLSPEDVAEIRSLRGQAGWSYGALGRAFGVDGSTCWKLCNGRTWKKAERVSKVG